MQDHPDIPRHIAVIMDGNGRWAGQRGLPRRDGHRAGAESVREVTEACMELGVEYLTLYAFSSENWSRPSEEVEALMSLLDRFLSEKQKELRKQNIRLVAIGQLERLPEKTRNLLEEIMEETADHDAMTLVLALSYGAREEIVAASRSIAKEVADGKLDIDAIDCATFADHLQTKGIPDPDLLVRSSGEMRVSNFLLWQISYAEIVIVKKYWPDFRKGDLLQAVEEYRRRHRRFGGL
ncbi:MAG: isoprenyl transferase [Phycisphaeraceae bacterium]|nr:isoprenyl transferase [Phycisphaeraceae bacterium]